MRQYHQDKIDRQLKLPSPDWGAIHHWQKEIDNWDRQIAAIDRKLEE
jgi:hypothetical protein